MRVLLDVKQNTWPNHRDGEIPAHCYLAVPEQIPTYNIVATDMGTRIRRVVIREVEFSTRLENVFIIGFTRYCIQMAT